ncbi:MAG: TrmH family RNA methyltransferase [Candidatus Paceibacterota bacterium]
MNKKLPNKVKNRLGSTKNAQREVVVVLDNIRSTHNVGAIFRTCDAAGISRIFLAGVTPCPVDRFGRERADIAKTALGAEKTILWEYCPETVTLIRRLKKDGYKIIAVEQDEKSEDYKKVKLKSKIVFVFGNEVAGVSKKVLKISDVIAEIPMMGQKESLNVSVSVGVALFRMLGV